MALQNTTTLPVQYLISVTRSQTTPNTLYVIGRMTWDTIGIYVFDVSSGTPVQLGAFNKTAVTDPTAVLAIGRYLYLGSATPNATNYLAPFGVVEAMQVVDLRKPTLYGRKLRLPSPPTKIVSIDNSEFRIVTVGNNAELAPGSYIVTARFTGASFIPRPAYRSPNRYSDIVVRSSFSGVQRNHILYAASPSEIAISSIREADLLIQPVPSTMPSSIKLPIMLFDTLMLSPGGSYLYAGGKDPNIDYGMLFAYDIRATPTIVGYFGEFGFLPKRMIVTATKLVVASDATIISHAQMSTYTGAP